MAQAIDAATFLVDHEQRRPLRDRLHLFHQLAEMRRAVDVPPEQHDGVRTRLREDGAFERRECLTDQADAKDVRRHSSFQFIPRGLAPRRNSARNQQPATS
jgi:hypothetical protein